MRKGAGSKSRSKGASGGVSKRTGASSSRSKGASRPRSSAVSANRRSSGTSGSGGSWFLSGGLSSGSWGEDAPPRASEGGLGRVLGEGLASGLADELGSQMEAREGSAAFWSGVAVCALLVAVVVLVLYVNA